MALSFKDKACEGKCYFGVLFKELSRCPIQKVMEMISKFPLVLTNDMNKVMEENVSKDEVKVAIHTLQRDKSDGPNSLLVEFYIDFYEFLKEYLLKVVKESK